MSCFLSSDDCATLLHLLIAPAVSISRNYFGIVISGFLAEMSGLDLLSSSTWDCANPADGNVLLRIDQDPFVGVTRFKFSYHLENVPRGAGMTE